jgi:hypothetical protein
LVVGDSEFLILVLSLHFDANASIWNSQASQFCLQQVDLPIAHVDDGKSFFSNWRRQALEVKILKETVTYKNAFSPANPS